MTGIADFNQASICSWPTSGSRTALLAFLFAGSFVGVAGPQINSFPAHPAHKDFWGHTLQIRRSPFWILTFPQKKQEPKRVDLPGGTCAPAHLSRGLGKLVRARVRPRFSRLFSSWILAYSLCNRSRSSEVMEITWAVYQWIKRRSAPKRTQSF